MAARIGRKDNPLKRKERTRKQKRLFLIATEGSVTEKQYLTMDCFKSRTISLKFAKHQHIGRTDPASVLKRMDTLIRETGHQPDDEAWVIIDVDQWTAEQLRAVTNWEKKRTWHHTAISNPKIELFILVHFPGARRSANAREIDKRLKTFFPAYDKKIPEGKFTEEDVRRAISACETYYEECDGIPSAGCTSLHRLAKKLLPPA